MNKKTALLISGFLLTAFCSGSVFAANMYWIGGTSDWDTVSNWGGTGALPTSADWVDMRSDAWVANPPEITTGQTATTGTIRMNPGYGPETPSITVDGGTLNAYGEIYIGDVGGPADFIIDSGTVNIGLGGISVFTSVGGEGSTGQLFINGGTFNAGTLGVPKWYGGPSGSGLVHVDGGTLYATELILGSGGANGQVDITEGTLVIDGDVRTTVNGYISSGHITVYDSSDPSAFTIVYDGLNTIVTAVVPIDPKLASSPTPVDLAEGIDPSVVLTWQSPTGVSNPTYNVYLGIDGSSLNLKSQSQTALSYAPTANLDFETTYDWRIDVNDPNSGNPVTHTGVVWTFTTGGGKAYDPKPAFKESVVANNILTQDTVDSVTLSWQAPGGAISQEVYFGDNFDDVGNADISDTTGMYKGSQLAGDTNYGPVGVIPDATYYWRIDEVYDAPDPNRLKGDIWSFSVPSYFYSGEDFESYKGTTYLLRTWKDSTDAGNNTGSVIEIELDNTSPVVHQGNNSMKFEYDNSGSSGADYYSEISTKCIVRDWTKNNIKALTLFFYGQPGNSSERLYIALEDANINIHTVAYPNPDHLSEPEWHEWNIDLQDFNGGSVNLMDVDNIYIGFGDKDNPVVGGSGTVYFDDIRLHQFRCVAENGPTADINGDCMVTFEDLELLAGDWLNMSTSSAIPTGHKRIYLLGGQSNMVGVGLNAELPAGLQLPQPEVQVYAAGQLDPTKSNVWADLQPGVGFNEFCFGPEITFGHDMADAQSSDVILIKYSVGGTSLWSDWHAPDISYPNGGPQYEAFINTVNGALSGLSLGYEPYIAGMIWMQGESDSSDLDRAQTYEQNLTDLIQSIRSDFGVPNMPFVIGQISNQYGYTYGPAVQQAQYNVSQTLPNTALVVTDDLTLNADNIHFDAAGQIKLGTRFADQLIIKSDINEDLKIDFKDFAELASQWLETKIWP